MNHVNDLLRSCIEALWVFWSMIIEAQEITRYAHVARLKSDGQALFYVCLPIRDQQIERPGYEYVIKSLL